MCIRGAPKICMCEARLRNVCTRRAYDIFAMRAQDMTLLGAPIHLKCLWTFYWVLCYPLHIVILNNYNFETSRAQRSYKVNHTSDPFIERVCEYSFITLKRGYVFVRRACNWKWTLSSASPLWFWMTIISAIIFTLTFIMNWKDLGISDSLFHNVQTKLLV